MLAFWAEVAAANAETPAARVDVACGALVELVSTSVRSRAD